MKTILFQGDSITDVGRSREDNTLLGWGYARFVEAQLGFEHPEEYEFQNRGVAGNRVLDLYARIVQDMLNIKPDYMSILIGVNDVWQGIDDGNGTGHERYEKVYDMLISELLEAFPNLKLMLLEPFVVPGSVTNSTEEQPDRWEIFNTGVRKNASIVKKLAQKHNVKFIPLQDKFDALLKIAPADYWFRDGVHPNAKGHELIKQEWLKAFNEIK